MFLFVVRCLCSRCSVCVGVLVLCCVFEFLCVLVLF